MKSSYLSLTFIIAFLPALVPTFNISIPAWQVDRHQETRSNTTNLLTEHQHTRACSHNSFINSSLEGSTPLAFGAELGSYIRSSQRKDANFRIKTVVIDPGHGGKDPGCSGTNTREKEIALSIALKLGQSLQQNFPGIQFIYTRQSDIFVPLDRRAEIANANKADLFISIHCNNFPHSGNVKGTETYVLGLHRAKDNLEVAKRENSAIFYEDNYQQTYDGYDPNSAEGHIILSMFQNAFLEQSISFANKIEGNIKKHSQLRSRGVKQAGFLVLRKTTMPSVLVEAGYLSNSFDNQLMSTSAGQGQVVNAIAKAFADYKQEVEYGSVAIVPDAYATTTINRQFTAKGAVNPVPKQKKTIIKSPVAPKQKNFYPVSNTPKHPSSPSLIIPAEKNQAPTNATESNTLLKSQPITSVQYKVVLAASTKLVDTNVSPWNTIPYAVQVTKEKKLFRYMAIGFDSFEAAVNAKQSLRQSGFGEAFLVAYQNGKRIDMATAKAQTGIK